MGTISGATVNKIMTNTWLDSKISPVYHAYKFLTFTITWKITNGTYTITRNCTYKAVNRQNDRITYVLTQCTYVAGITDAALNTSMIGHVKLQDVSRVLNKIYLPIINSNITISNLLSMAEFIITSASVNLGNLSPGSYTLSQIQSAISSVGTTISVNNSSTLTTVEKTLYDITNAGVEYGGNYINYRGVPPSAITNYITRTPVENNSSRRAITQRDFLNVFRNVEILNYRCVREDIDMFNNITFYPTLGTSYLNYVEPESTRNTLSININISKTNNYVIIPPTLTGIEYWNGQTGNFDNSFTQYLSLYRADEDINDGITISVNNSAQKLNANDIAFNYENVNNKISNRTTFSELGFFGKYTIGGNTNDMYGATLGVSSVNSTTLKLARNRKVYPGDVYNRRPYITPRIIFETDQSLPVNIYNVDYLPMSDAAQHYKHPTMNRSLTTSDGLEADSNGKAIVPVIYIPSTIRLYQAGTCSYTMNTSGTYPVVTVSFSSNISFYVYRYAYGNRGSVPSHTTTYRVRTSEIYDLDTFMSQLRSGRVIDGRINFTQTFQSGSTGTGSVSCNPTITFSYSTDSSGNLVITASASRFTSTSLYLGRTAKSTVVNSIEVTMSSTGIDGFLLGPITSYERTTNITQTLWSYVNTSTGSGTSSASTLSLDDDGIDTADFVIGSFDEFDE